MHSLTTSMWHMMLLINKYWNTWSNQCNPQACILYPQQWLQFFQDTGGSFDPFHALCVWILPPPPPSSPGSRGVQTRRSRTMLIELKLTKRWNRWILYILFIEVITVEHYCCFCGYTIFLPYSQNMHVRLIEVSKLSSGMYTSVNACLRAR